MKELRFFGLCLNAFACALCTQAALSADRLTWLFWALSMMNGAFVAWHIVRINKEWK